MENSNADDMADNVWDLSATVDDGLVGDTPDTNGRKGAAPAAAADSCFSGMLVLNDFLTGLFTILGKDAEVSDFLLFKLDWFFVAAAAAATATLSTWDAMDSTRTDGRTLFKDR